MQGKARIERSKKDKNKNPQQSAHRRKVYRKIAALREKGMTLKQISDYLNENQIPTFSGRGFWQKGLISRHLKEAQQ